MENEQIFEILSNSTESVVKYLYRRDVLGTELISPVMVSLQEEIRGSERVQAMLNGRGADGRFPWHAYAKWRGAYWTLFLLADLGYPAGDVNLFPLREQVLEWLFNPHHLNRVPLVDGRYRRCAVQESSAVFSMLKLGLDDERTIRLVDLLLKWQWPDGGWNCDKKKTAAHSSFHESWMPVRALWAYYELSGDPRAREAVERASEIFLSRRLFRRLSDGEVMYEGFTHLSYPTYWHYDILNGLMMMGEIGRLDDPRCTEALDLLETKRLPNGGFPAELRYYTVTNREVSGVSPVGWGAVSKRKLNEFVSVRALSVLKWAGRVSVPKTDYNRIIGEDSQ